MAALNAWGCSALHTWPAPGISSSRASIGASEDQRRRDTRVLVLERDGQGPAPRESTDDRAGEAQRSHQLRQAVRVFGKPPRLVRVHRPTTTRRVPSDDGELVPQVVELRSPRAAVHQDPVQQHERRAGAHHLDGDVEAVDGDVLHIDEYG